MKKWIYRVAVFFAPFVLSQWSSAEESSVLKKIEDLENRLATIEAERSLQAFTFGSFFSAGQESIDLESGHINLYRLKVGLSANAKVSDRLYFYSQLWMSKYFNNLERQNFSDSVFDDNLFSSSQFTGTDIRFSKAYIDYFFDVADVRMALSVGRLPTGNGPPAHYRDGLPRQGTYPLMSYNVELDGFALTADFGAMMPENQSLVFRAVYSPFNFIRYGADSAPLQRPTGLNGEKKDSTDNVYSLVAEYSAENLDNPVFSKSLSIFQFTHWNDGSLADVSVSGATVKYPDDMFDIHFYSFFQEFGDLFSWDLDLSFSYLISSVNTKRTAESTLTGTPVQLGLRNDGTGVVSAGILLINLIKRLPLEFLNNPQLGVEYVKGERNSLTPNQFNRTEDETEFYSTMGKAFHVYWVQPIEDNLTLRLGYRQQDREFSSNNLTQGGLGFVDDDNQTIRTLYGRMVMQF